MSEKVVSKFIQSLIDDNKTLDKIESSLNDIMKDGKVTSSDIPDIFNIVIECCDNLGKFNLSYNELPEILEELINYILEHYDLIPDDEEEDFQKMISTVIKLVMLQPKIKKGCIKLWGKLTSCCKK